jgi:hypothetical protein
MKVPPRAARTHTEINAAVNAALHEDPRIGEKVAFARRFLATSEAEPAGPPAGFWGAIEDAVELLRKTKAGPVLPEAEWFELALLLSTVDLPRAEDGTPLPVKGELLVTGVPGIDGRPLWLLRGQADIAAMRRQLAPGQVWIRADLIKADDWPRMTALASDQVRRVLGKVRRPGPAEGRRNEARKQLVERVRKNPRISDDEINRLGVEADLWQGESRDYVLVRDRARRIRKSAGF